MVVVVVVVGVGHDGPRLLARHDQTEAGSRADALDLLVTAKRVGLVIERCGLLRGASVS